MKQKKASHLSRTDRFLRELNKYFYVIPAVAFLSAFTLWPILRSVYLSFFETDSVFSFMDFVGLQHYRTMMHSPVFWEVCKNTIVYGVLQVLLTTVVGFFCALVANSDHNKLKSLFKVAMFYPYILPWTVAAMVWMYMYNPTRGIINAILGVRIQWLNSYDITLYALVLVCVWKSVGYNFLLFLSGLQSLPKELFEACRLETNSFWKTTWHITIPLMMPTVFVAVLLSIVGSFQSVDLIYIMTQGRPGNSTNTLIYYIYDQGVTAWKIGYGSALSTVLFVSLLIFTLLYIKLGDRRVEYDR